MQRAFASIGAAVTIAAVAVAACGGGTGPAVDDHRGPDGLPSPSGDSPGNGREGPGSTGQDPPGASNQNSPACLDCSGNYLCSSTGAPVPGSQNDTSIVTLVPIAGGCGVVVDQGQTNGGTNTSESTLLCGGQFIASANGSTVLVGQWSGGTGRFTVSATIEGKAVSVTCVTTDQSPQPQPQPGGGQNLDAG